MNKMTQRDFFNKLLPFRDKRPVTKKERQQAVSLLYEALDSGVLRIETAQRLCCSYRFPVYWQAPSYATLWQLNQDIKAGKEVYGIC